MDAGADPLVARLRAAGCVFAEEEARHLRRAAAESRAGPAALEALVVRRERGEPLEQVVGWVEFCGLRLPVEPGVFVPRRRTELLVREAVSRVAPGALVVDLCCGNGAVGAAIASAGVLGGLVAADISATAVRCARRSLEPLGGRATVYQGDLIDALPARLAGRVDVLVANPPYVPSDQVERMPAEARLHEPRIALDGGADGLDVQRRVVADAPRWLSPGAVLLIESSQQQAESLAMLVAAAGLVPQIAADEDLGATVVVGSSAA